MVGVGIFHVVQYILPCHGMCDTQRTLHTSKGTYRSTPAPPIFLCLGAEETWVDYVQYIVPVLQKCTRVQFLRTIINKRYFHIYLPPTYQLTYLLASSYIYIVYRSICPSTPLGPFLFHFGSPLSTIQRLEIYLAQLPQEPSIFPSTICCSVSSVCLFFSRSVVALTNDFN